MRRPSSAALLRAMLALSTCAAAAACNGTTDLTAPTTPTSDSTAVFLPKMPYPVTGPFYTPMGEATAGEPVALPTGEVVLRDSVSSSASITVAVRGGRGH